MRWPPATPGVNIVRWGLQSRQVRGRPRMFLGLYRWKKHFACFGVSERRRFKQFEEENKKLKALLADLSPDRQIL
ncbi:hypothetical protein K2X85_20880 [bacterium]|nr:hypothetical protein [bacterium]